MRHVVHIALVMVAVLAWSRSPAQRHVVSFAPESALPAKWTRPVRVADSTAAVVASRDMLRFLQSKGYLEAHIDSCSTHGGITTCPVHVGPAYRWARLSGKGV
ncbi:MAG TPA: hypothetical protein PLN54_02960, partial [Flavobacteriales bacterium]|nr:hypothetical protein [Flavobacteriales bacterium]